MAMRRRQLLQMTSAQLVAMGLPVSVPAASALASGPLKVVQWGTSHAHASGKLAALRSLPSLWEVTGLIEPDPRRAAKVAPQAPYAGLPILDVEAVLSDPQVKLVVVEEGIESCCEAARRCIEAGKHVHLDKPGALGHHEFKQMRQLAANRGLIVQMGYMLRVHPGFVLLRQAVREGWLGQITEIDAAMGKLADPGTRAKLKALPGGGFFELACHLLDQVIDLMGEPSQIKALSTPTGADGVADNQVALLGFGKASALIRCNHADPLGGPKRHFDVSGSNGSFSMQPLEGSKAVVQLIKPAGPWRAGLQEIDLKTPKDRYAAEFELLWRCIVMGEPFLWSAEHDLRVHRTLLAASGLGIDGKLLR